MHRCHRRFLAVAVAMLLPGTDPVTLLLSMLPLLVLYEGSILIAAFLDRRARRHAEDEEEEHGLDVLHDDPD